MTKPVMFEYEIEMDQIGPKGWETRKVKVKGSQYLDFAIRKSEKGRGYIVDHIPTGRRAGYQKNGRDHLFGTVARAKQFIEALYELGPWESANNADYKPRREKAREIAARFAA